MDAQPLVGDSWGSTQWNASRPPQSAATPRQPHPSPASAAVSEPGFPPYKQPPQPLTKLVSLSSRYRKMTSWQPALIRMVRAAGLVVGGSGVGGAGGLRCRMVHVCCALAHT